MEREKIPEILIGFVVCYVVNSVIWLALTASGDTVSGADGWALLYNIAVLPANVIVLIVLAIIRRTRYYALGILIAYALNLLISLIIGATVNGVCFIPFFIK